MAKPKYDTSAGQYGIVPQYTDPLPYNIVVGKGSFQEVGPQFLGSEGVGESKHDIDIRPQDVQYLDELRSMRQTGFDQFGNALVQAGAEVVGGTIEGIGYLGEVGNIADIVNGTETEFGNALSEFGKSIKESSREAFPIYQDYGEGFHPGNFSWWMTHAPSIASSLSLMIPSGAATGVISTLAKSTGLMAKLGAKGGAIAKGATQAVFSRHMENMMEASQSYDEIYQKNIRNGLTVDDAKQNAAIGAASVYNRNWAMLAQDIPQYVLLATGLKGMKGLSATGKEISEGVTKTGRSLIAAKAKPSLNLLKVAVGEGAEESYQFVVQKEADYLAQRELDPSIEGDFSDRMNEYLKDGEMWTSAWFGAMGATAMQGLSSVNNKLTKGRVLAQDVKSWGAETSRMHKTIMTATELENTNLVQAGMDAGLGNMLHRAAVHGNMDKFREYIDTVGKEDVTDKELSKVVYSIVTGKHIA